MWNTCAMTVLHSIEKRKGNVMFNEIWPLISVVLGIIILLVLIIGFKLNTFISLIITSMITALMLGIPLTKIMETIEKGMGSTLGHIALIFGLGAILGKLLADGGGATRIADTLIQKFGQNMCNGRCWSQRLSLVLLCSSKSV